MLKHAYQSLTLNPEWMRTQHQLIAQATHGVLNAAAIAKQISDAQIRRSQQTMREMARQSDNFNDVLLGQQYTRDTHRPDLCGADGPRGHAMDGCPRGGQVVRDGSRSRVR
jgi:hypothetical protein